MRSIIATFITMLCLPKRFEKWSLEARFKYSQRLWRNLDPTVKFAIWVTVSFLVLIFLFSFASGCAQEANCSGSKYANFWSAKPNEIGDTLAGVSGSLAFFWLIVTVMLQGKQLSAQRRELVLTRREFEKMSEAQKKQVEIMDVQKVIFLKEQKQREEAAAGAEFHNLLEQLNEELKLERLRDTQWDCWYEDQFGSRRLKELRPFYLRSTVELSLREKLEHISRKLSDAERLLITKGAEIVGEDQPTKFGPVMDLFQIVEEMAKQKPALSNADASKLHRWRIMEIYSSLQTMMNADVWKEAN